MSMSIITHHLLTAVILIPMLRSFALVLACLGMAAGFTLRVMTTSDSSARTCSIPGLTIGGIAANACYEISDSSGGIKLMMTPKFNSTTELELNAFAQSSDCTGTPLSGPCNYTLGTCNGFINDGACTFFSKPYTITSGASALSSIAASAVFALLMVSSLL